MPGIMRRCLDAGTVACLTMVSVLALACYASAGPPSTSAAAERTATTNNRADPDPGKATQAAKRSDDSKAGRRKAPLPSAVNIARSQSGAKRARPSEPELEPQGPPPQWGCDALSISLEPIWAGKALQATWVIKNEGEGDLVIKARGG